MVFFLSSSEKLLFPILEHAELAILLFSNSRTRQTQLIFGTVCIYESIREKCSSFTKGRASSNKVMPRDHRKNVALLNSVKVDWYF